MLVLGGVWELSILSTFPSKQIDHSLKFLSFQGQDEWYRRLSGVWHLPEMANS